VSPPQESANKHSLLFSKLFLRHHVKRPLGVCACSSAIRQRLVLTRKISN